jgi:hypothetical protein
MCVDGFAAWAARRGIGNEVRAMGGLGPGRPETAS